MPKKDTKSLLDDIESKQDVKARLEEKVERLSMLVDKQRRIISDQTSQIDQQKEKLSKMVDIPDDIRELREMIGTQRAQINEKEIEIEHTKGLLAQTQKELELTKNRMNPTQIKVEAALETIGKLKEELTQKNSEIMVKNETIRTLSNKYSEAEASNKILRKRAEEAEGGGATRKEIEELKIQHSEERKELKSEITKLESQLLDQKLEFEEKIAEANDMSERYNDLVEKVNELTEKNNEAKEEIKRLHKDMEDQVKELNAKMEDLRQFREENIARITFLDKLKPIMEEDPLFRAFFLILEVGHISLDDLRAAVGSPIVVVKKDVQRLENVGLIEQDEAGKISVKKFE
jgi:chromosome segregation ATPase